MNRATYETKTGARASERTQLKPFNALSGAVAARDAQDIMAYPFFSLAKGRRTVPIDFHSGSVVVRVEGTAEHGIATIWDADVLIWAASHLIEARDAQLPTSRLITTTPYEILKFVGRGTSIRDYQRLRAALDRLQSTTIATSIRQPSTRRLHRFSWINEWTEQMTSDGRSAGLEMILPDWFYRGIVDASLVLTIHPTYFRLTGGLERWLYRLARKHAGHQASGWRFDMRHLHAKSGSLSRPWDFAFDIRQIVIRQPIPGYQLSLERDKTGAEHVAFLPRTAHLLRSTIQQLVPSMRPVDNP